MVVWEGAADYYRDMTHHGGILSNAFIESWYPRQVLSVQHGRGVNGPQDPWLGEPTTGPETLTEEQLAANRADFIGDIRNHPLDDEFHRTRSADFSKITAPFLSAANWAGFGLHERGNFEGFTESASQQKWLEVHPGRHEEYFYLPYGVDVQMRFLDHFLKGENNGWDRLPPVSLTIRHPNNRFELREEHEWPLARTNWTRLYLDAGNLSLSWDKPVQAETTRFEAMGDGLTFMSPPLATETEITGPLSARLFISSSTGDADLFVTFRAFDADDKEVDFQGTIDPHTPLAQGWLRASHRKLDLNRSQPYRPYHPHREVEPLAPGEVYQLNIEVWPTCVVLPAGYRLALTVQGRDFERRIVQDTNEVWTSSGSGPFLHTDPSDRSASIFAGTTTIYTGTERDSFLLLPVVPSRGKG